LEDPKYSNQTVKDFIKENNYNSDFLNLYLIPMSSAVWSTPKDKILDFPILSLVRFFYNHGFLGLNTQHQWKTVVNGSRQYAEKITAPVKDKIYLNHKAISVSQNEKGVSIQFENGKKIEFDRVILACHGDTALEILENPTAKQKDYLSHFKYEKNIAVLHTDDSIMPKTKLSWSSWNYRIEKDQTQTPCTIYWMNRLQGVSDKKNYFVSINNPEIINPSKIIKTIHYEHPLFSAGTYLTQPKLPELNENSRVYFTGSYFRYGFHEDALTSSVNLCEKILGRKVWN
jgi:predicted NAD/FAD-binding protein